MYFCDCIIAPFCVCFMPKENKDMKKTPNPLIILVALSLLLSGCNVPPSSSSSSSEDSAFITSSISSSNSSVSESSSSTSIAPKTYTVTWKNYDGSILEVDENVIQGDTPTFNGLEPTRAATAQYNYVFNGWSPVVTPVNGNTEYTATFKEETRKYTVTWKNYDGSILDSEEVLYGTIPTYNGDTPTRGDTVEHTYTFEGWSPNVVEVSESISYVASFKEEKRKYNVTWKDEDGNILRVDSIAYGDTPNYGESVPTKDNTAQYAYSFDKWVPAISKVVGDMEYTAVFNREIRKYTITWLDEDGTVLEIDENIPYGDIPHYNGDIPSKEGARGVDYVFDGWDTDIAYVQGDKTYTATFKEKAYFSFKKINYEMEDGYTLNDINGAPWINANIDGEIDKIKKPSPKDDFFAFANYERIKENGGSAFNAAQYQARDVLNDVLADPDIENKTTNGLAIQTIFQKTEQGDADGVANYLNNIDVENYLNTKDCFASQSSVLEIEPGNGCYIVHYNDGYINSNYSILPFLFNYSRTTQTAMYILSALSESLGLGLSNRDINSVYSYDYQFTDVAYADYSEYGSAYDDYTVETVPWEPMKNALLDLGLPANQRIVIYKFYQNCFNSLYNNYYVNNQAILKKDIIARLAFDYRYFIGVENYKIINQYLSYWPDFFEDEYSLYAYSNEKIAGTIAMISVPVIFQQAYIELGSSPEIKTEVTELIIEILTAYKQMAENITWLSPQTKAAMIRKIEYMGYASCYSESHKNFVKIVDDNTPSKSAFDIYRIYANALVSEKTSGAYDFSSFFEYYPCYMVNAFYSPTTNSINILNGLAAGMLGGSTEETYALVGTIIGHEITHGFDTDGSLYDEYGQQNNWWTSEDRKTFEGRVDKLIKFYDQIYLKDGYKVDGENVSEEATADLGGMKIILQIVKKFDNFDYDEFFKKYAYLWCCYTHDISMVEYYAEEDGHPYNYLRANVTLAQFDEFVETYDIKPGDGMYLPEEERIKVW